MPQDQEANAPNDVLASTPARCAGVEDTEPVVVAVVDVKVNQESKDNSSVSGSSDKPHQVYQCGFCNGLVDSKEALVSHDCFLKPNVNVLYECQECKTYFPTLEALACHMAVHEQHVLVLDADTQSQLTRLGYRCSLCDKYLSSKGSLVKHQQLHQGLKPYLCNFCNKSFSLKGNRDKHELIHAGERPHKCTVCEKSFTLKGNLQQHILTHTSLKLYKCSMCDSEFTLKGNLSKHIKRHENGWKRKVGKGKCDTEEGCHDDDGEDVEKTKTPNSKSKRNVAKSKPAKQVESVAEISEPVKTTNNIHKNKDKCETISDTGNSGDNAKKEMKVDTLDENKQLESSVNVDSVKEEKSDSVEQKETTTDKNMLLNDTLKLTCVNP